MAGGLIGGARLSGADRSVSGICGSIAGGCSVSGVLVVFGVLGVDGVDCWLVELESELLDKVRPFTG